MEKRQRQGKEREIMECVKEYPLKANHTRKKEKSYQQLSRGLLKVGFNNIYGIYNI
jgi:hypothetical protein